MPIFLDNNSTTPIDESVLQAMLPYLVEQFGNPSSLHTLGRLARNAMDRARRELAELLDVQPEYIVFTSGATEAANMVLRGSAALYPGKRILVSMTEHSAVLETAWALERRGIDIEWVPVNGDGLIDINDLECRLDDTVSLLAVMAANNETGVVQDTASIGELARQSNVTFFCDAVQVPGKLAASFAQLGADIICLSAHKMYGPKGIGAVVMRDSGKLPPLLTGGGQESGLRGGTENVAGVAGFGAAAALVRQLGDDYLRNLERMRDALLKGLEATPGCTIFGQRAPRLPNTLQFSIAETDGAAVQMALDRQGIAVSTGSACHNRTGEPSHVLRAMGVAETVARGAVRVSLGKGNRLEDIESLLRAIKNLAAGLPDDAVTGWN